MMQIIEGTPAEVLAGLATWSYVCGDGIAFAAAREPGSFDHAIGDPPYDETTHAGARSSSREGIGNSASRLKHGGKVIDIDFPPCLPADVAPAIVRVIRRWALLFCAETMLGDYKRAVGERYVRSGCWHRTNSTPQLNGKTPSQGTEAIAILRGSAPMRWNKDRATTRRHGDQALWTGPIAGADERYHPTPKPLWLMRELLLDFTDQGEAVLDPTGGGGTTTRAARGRIRDRPG